MLTPRASMHPADLRSPSVTPALSIIVLISISRIALGVELEDGAITAAIGGTSPPWGKIIYVNGVSNSPDVAKEGARAIAAKLGHGTHLVYNDLRMDGLRSIDQGIALLIEKLGDCDTSVNAATDTLKREIKTQCQNGNDIWLVGHSAGCLCIQNAVRCVVSDWEKDNPQKRDQFVQHIKVLYVGGAVFPNDHGFSDETPRGVARFDIHDVLDGVAQFAGVGDWGEDEERAHSLTNYLPWVAQERFGQTGALLVRSNTTLLETVAAAPSPDDRVLRIFVEDLRKSQESRRTQNFAIPWRGETVLWSIPQHPRRAEVRFTLMEDTSFWSDEPKSRELQHSVMSEAFGGSDNYLGRFRLKDSSEDALWTLTPGGFTVEARPARQEGQREGASPRS